MKLRKALQSIVGTPIASGQNVGKSFFPATNMSVPNQFNILVTGNSSKVPPSSRLNIDDLNDSKRLSCAHTSPGRQSVHSVAVTDTTSFLLSPRAVAQSKAKAVEPERMTKKPVTRIYDWEDGRKLRGKIQVDDDSFVPTSVAGVYVREDGMDQMPSSEKWIDVKVVLDQDELKTLASRKKALKRVQKMGLASSNFVSVQSSTPYIDQRRIVKETYRPDHPEKWLNPVYHNK